MSRIIVKNLPKKIKEDRVRSIFGEIGPLTDCSFKYTKEGAFRRFAFIGYTSEDVASKAVKHFNQSFIDTSRLVVEIAKELGDESKARAWSKYSQESSAYKRIHGKPEEENKSKKENKSNKEKKKNSHVDELLGDLKDNAEFKEFLEVNKARSNKSLWGNDDLAGPSEEAGEQSKEKEKEKSSEGDGMEVDEVESEQSDEVILTPKEEQKTGKKEKKKVANEKISDLDYLKSKKVTMSGAFSDTDSESESDSESEKDSDVDSDGNDDVEDEKQNSEEDKDIDEKDDTSKSQFKYLVKMKGIPPNSKEAQIRDFFKPIKLTHVKIPHGSKGSTSQSIATVEFGCKEDQEQALRRNKNFIGPKRIFLHKLTEEIPVVTEVKQRQWEIKTGQEEDEETIAESGRLYVRNLAYCCKEADLESLFAKYGPVSEIHNHRYNTLIYTIQKCTTSCMYVCIQQVACMCGCGGGGCGGGCGAGGGGRGAGGGLPPPLARPLPLPLPPLRPPTPLPLGGRGGATP